MQHTLDYYNFFTEAFRFYNERLFNNELPEVMVTITRKKNTGGYFSADRWVGENGESIHEIAMNPNYHGRSSILATLSVLVHEMAHLKVYLKKKKQSGYHCKQWTAVMKECGLAPVSLDEGRKNGLGQKVSHQILADGLFVEITKDFKSTLKYAEAREPQKLSINIVHERDSFAPNTSDTPDDIEIIADDDGKEYAIIDNEKVEVIFGDKGQYFKQGESGEFDEPLVAEIKPVSDNDKLEAILPSELEALNESLGNLVGEPPMQGVLESDEFLKKHSLDLEELDKKKPKRKSNAKVKYSCQCDKPNNTWGRPGLSMMCLDCNGVFEPELDDED